MLEEVCTAPLLTQAPPYTGPERRGSTHALTRWLVRMLDEMDHGMLLLTPEGLLRHANQPARLELARSDTLQLSGSWIQAARRDQQGGLLNALCDAGRGRRRLIMLGQGQLLPAAAVPLDETSRGADVLVLLLLGKRQNCEGLSVDFFAHTHGLTSAEARVLQALCGGLRPKEVAQQFDVAVSTVRTQISSIRNKTQTASIRDLIDRVSTLPPIASRMQRPFLAH